MMTRRTFMTTTAAAGIAASQDSEASQPLMITDAQVHLWEANRLDRPWPAGTTGDLPEPLTAERMLPIMDAAGVARAVIAPPAVAGFDPTYALECAARYPKRFAVTSRWNLDDAGARARLPTWMKQKGLIGIRLGLAEPVRTKWRESGVLDQFWADAAEYDIPLMIFAPGSIVEIATAAKKHPKLRLVVDHVNLAGSKPETVNAKIDDLIELRQFDNVGVKLGALPLWSAGSYPFTDLHEPLHRVYNAFGARRLMWASDITTSLKAKKASYQENVDLARREAFKYVPTSDLEWILGRTVSEWFNWPA